MKKTNKLGVFLIVLGVLFAISGISFLPEKDYITAIVSLLLSAVCIYFGVKRIKNPPELKQIEKDQTEQPKKEKKKYKKDLTYFDFRVAGTTFDNEDGSSRQDIIRKLADDCRAKAGREYLYGEMKNSDILEKYDGSHETSYVYELQNEIFPVEFQEYVYKGSPALHVVTNRGIIGNVPADLVDKVLDLQSISYKTKHHGSFVGGKTKFVEFDYDKDCDVVRTKTLTYGIEVRAIFYTKEEQ